MHVPTSVSACSVSQAKATDVTPLPPNLNNIRTGMPPNPCQEIAPENIATNPTMAQKGKALARCACTVLARAFLSILDPKRESLSATRVIVEGLPDISDVPEWIRVTLIAVPPTGENDFEMGSNANSDEKPVHRVVVGPYYMMNCTVTNAMWKKFRGKTPSPKGLDGDDQPVVNVCWHEARAFADWVTKESKGKVKFSLPTEAQWEWAARGGEANQKWATGSGNISPAEANYGDGEDGKTVDVYAYLPNALGFYQMSGNVSEWCADWYSGGYYFSSPKENPTGPYRGDYRVLRGGSYRSGEIYCRSTDRGHNSPGIHDSSWGFRLAAVLPGT